MILYPCTNCGKAFRVIGETAEIYPLIGPESETWPNFPCPVCEANVIACMEDELDPAAVVQLAPREITAVELYAAQQGMGLPEEKDCSRRVVLDAFKKGVKQVVGYQLKGTSRFVLTQLQFEDGTRMFLAASSYGALIYRMTSPVTAAQEGDHG